MAKKTEKKGASSKKPPQKAKQLKLPAEGMSRKRIPEVDDAAEAYRVARDERMAHTKVEKEKKAKLLETAKKHGIKVYVFEDEDGEELEVEYTAKTDENVTVRKVKAEADDE
jgi:hypothetical protein